MLGLCVAFLAAIAVANSPGPRTSKIHAIVSNLQQLEGAVQMWGIDHHQTGAVAVTWEDVAPYLRADPHVQGGMKSEAGEVYVLKTLTQPPEAVLTRKLGDRPKGTVVRLETNGDFQIVLPKD